VDWRSHIIRVSVLALFVVAGWFAFVHADVPRRADGSTRLPAVALGQTAIYRLELDVAIVFAALLLVTPLVQGVVNGRLPTEITARGAKFDPEDVSQSLADAEQRITQVEDALRKNAATIVALSARVGTPPDEPG
jgi:hypothetical protein